MDLKKHLTLTGVYYVIVIIISIVLFKQFWNQQAMQEHHYADNLLPLIGLLILPLITLGLIFYNVVKMLFGQRERLPILMIHVIVLSLCILFIISWQ